MKAWALLNLRSYNLSCGKPCNAPRTPLGDWRNHESLLLNDLGIEGSLDDQTKKLLDWYGGYKSGTKSSISPSDFAQIEASSKEAIYDWYVNGTNSDADPVHGATGFIDAEGLYYPNGTETDQYYSSKDFDGARTNKAEIEAWRSKYYSNSSEVYTMPNHVILINGVWVQTWTFTWFH